MKVYRGILLSADASLSEKGAVHSSKVSREQFEGMLEGPQTVGDVDSPYVDQILWGTVDKSYALRVAASRYGARLAADPDFRQKIRENPNIVQLAVLEYEVDEADCYTFSENKDRVVQKFSDYVGDPVRVSLMVIKGEVTGAWYGDHSEVFRYIEKLADIELVAKTLKEDTDIPLLDKCLANFDEACLLNEQIERVATCYDLVTFAKRHSSYPSEVHFNDVLARALARFLVLTSTEFEISEERGTFFRLSELYARLAIPSEESISQAAKLLDGLYKEAMIHKEGSEGRERLISKWK